MPKKHRRGGKKFKKLKKYKGGSAWGTIKSIGSTALSLLPLLALGRVYKHPKVKKHFKGGVQLAAAPTPI